MAVTGLTRVGPAPPAATVHWGLALGAMVGSYEFFPGMSRYWHLMSLLRMPTMLARCTPYT